MMKKKFMQKGFTLVELLVVIAIIGLLATLSVLALGSARVRARDAKRVADVKTIQTALELYNNDQSGYPAVAAITNLGTTGSKSLATNGWSDAPTGTSYLPSTPKDPQSPTQDYKYKSRNADDSACTTGQCAAYTIQFTLESATAGLPAGAICARPPSTLNSAACPP